MKKVILVMSLVAFFAATSCNNGHKSQSWAPRTGKKMKKGHNAH
jgi:hypothetical protein